MFWNHSKETQVTPVFKVDNFYQPNPLLTLNIQDMLVGEVTALHLNDEVELVDLEGSIGLGEIMDADPATGAITILVNPETVVHG